MDDAESIRSEVFKKQKEMLIEELKQSYDDFSVKRYAFQPEFENSKKDLNDIFERELKHETKRLSQKLGKNLYLRKLIDEVGNFRFDINLGTKKDEVVKPAGKTQFGQFHIKISEDDKKIYVGGYYFDKSSKGVYDNLSQVIESCKGPLDGFKVDRLYFEFKTSKF